MASRFCDGNLPDFVTRDCVFEPGNIVAVALIKGDQSPTLANLREASFWTTKLNASPQKYYVILNTRGEYPGGTPTEEDGFGRTLVRRNGADHEVTFEVEGVEDNGLFVNMVNQIVNWKFVFVTSDNLAFFAEDVSIYGKIVIERPIKSLVRWAFSAKWTNIENPESFEAPALIFGE